MKVLITGAEGFIGQNLQLHLAERKEIEVVCFTRNHDMSHLLDLLQGVDFVFHLAGVNRPQDQQEFTIGNAQLTMALCQEVSRIAEASGKKVPIIFASSTQAVEGNPYGKSKLVAEQVLQGAIISHGIPIHIFRLPNVFGKWCKPNYNSVVATFCHNIARDMPIQVNDPNTPLTLVYIDDVIEHFVQLMKGSDAITGLNGFATVEPQYTTTVGQLASQINVFKDSRINLTTDRVGKGLVRALYSTYVSYLPVKSFSYTVPQNRDSRGVFTEMLKTPDCGQFSFFTAYPGITRGGHYHHSKTEKFLVVRGEALFKFRNMHTGQKYELMATSEKAEIIETVPGWTHDITNIGAEEMIVMLWANEMFDRERSDTYVCAV
ncbi:capsular polysaccharide biosynthesis protein CapF [Amylibacter sp.]|nr:capsular polysaccharide biosynthesis protein CapF [Amylibacter sp.]